MESKTNWLTTLLTQLPRFAGAIIGVVFTAIGGVMTVNIGLKTFVLGVDTPRYFEPEAYCEGKLRAPTGEAETQAMTNEEQEECITKRTEYEKESYKRQQKEDFVQGVAFLAIGVPFWLIFGRRRKEED